MSHGLVNPPMIVTDIPTNSSYNQPHYVFYSNGTVQGNTERYHAPVNNNVQNVLDLATVPKGFGITDFQNGVVVAYQVFTDDYAELQIRFAFHKAPGQAKQLASGWEVADYAAVGGFSGNFGDAQVLAKIGSQRQGEWLYFFVEYTAANIGAEYVHKMKRDEYFQQIYSRDLGINAPAGARQFDKEYGSYFVSDDYTPFIWHVNAPATRGAFTGERMNDLKTTVFGFVDDGTPLGLTHYVQDFEDENINSQSYSSYTGPGSGWHFTGKNGAYRQNMGFPNGVAGYGPHLVHSWRAGSYGPPELWWFVVEKNPQGWTTGRLKIYRSRWGRGNYVRKDNPDPTKPLGYVTQIAAGYDHPPVAVDPATFNFHPERARDWTELPIILDDDPNYNSKATYYPTLNPEGWAFEEDWYKPSNFIATIGPFPQPITNPYAGSAAAEQNAANLTNEQIAITGGPISHLEIKVMRDTHIRGGMHIIFADGGTHPDVFPSQSGFNGVWYASSSDDGQTWSEVQQISPPAHVNPSLRPVQNQVVRYQRLAATRTFNNLTVIGAGFAYRPDNLTPDTHVTLAVADWGAIGAGDLSRHPGVYRKGPLQRVAWL